MSRNKIEDVKWQLTEIAAADPDGIDSNDFEIMGEDEQGRDGYCTVQINKVSDNACQVINDLQKVVQMCFDDACKPSGKVSKKTAIELMKFADTRA